MFGLRLCRRYATQESDEDRHRGGTWTRLIPNTTIGSELNADIPIRGSGSLQLTLFWIVTSSQSSDLKRSLKQTFLPCRNDCPGSWLARCHSLVTRTDQKLNHVNPSYVFNYTPSRWHARIRVAYRVMYVFLGIDLHSWHMLHSRNCHEFCQSQISTPDATNGSTKSHHLISDGQLIQFPIPA